MRLKNLYIVLMSLLFSTVGKADCFAFKFISGIAINTDDADALERLLINEKSAGLVYKKFVQGGYIHIYSGKFLSKKEILAANSAFMAYVNTTFSRFLNEPAKAMQFFTDEECQKFPPFSMSYSSRLPTTSGGGSTTGGGGGTPDFSTGSKPGLLRDGDVPSTPGTIIVKPDVEINVDVGHPPIVMPDTYETDDSVPYEIQEQTFRRLVDPANGFVDAMSYCKMVSQSKAPLLGLVKYGLEFDVPVDYMKSGNYIFKEFGQPGHSYIVIECQFNNSGSDFSQLSGAPAVTVKLCRKELDGMNLVALPTGDKNQGYCGGAGADYREALERLRYSCAISKNRYSGSFQINYDYTKKCNL